MDDYRTSDDMLRDFRASHAAPQAPPEVAPPEVAAAEVAAPETPAPAPAPSAAPSPPTGTGDPFGAQPATEPYHPQTAPATGDDRHADWKPKGRSGPSNPGLAERFGKLRPLLLLVVIGAFAFGNVGSLFDGSTGVDSLTVGDCFDDPGMDGDFVEKVDTVDCAEPHDFEVFALPVYAAADSAEYPGEVTLFDWADEQCWQSFEGYVGIPFDQSELYFANMIPTIESWEQGDRAANCMLMRLDADFEVAPSVGSYRNTGV